MVKKKAPRLTIKSIKSRGYTPAYEARLIRAIRKGKRTRQSARGHKKKEHIIRKERERATSGITSTELAGIRSFLKRFNPLGFKDVPTEEDLVEFVRSRSYADFGDYRKTWDAYRRKYVAAQLAGELDHNGSLGYQLDHIVSQARVAPQGGDKWLYYH